MKIGIGIIIVLGAILAIAAGIYAINWLTPTAIYDPSSPGWFATPGSSVVCKRNDISAGIFPTAPADWVGREDGLVPVARIEVADPDADCRAYRFNWLTERRVKHWLDEGLMVTDYRQNQWTTRYPD